MLPIGRKRTEKFYFLCPFGLSIRRNKEPFFIFIYDLSIFFTSSAFVSTNAKHGIPLLRYTVFLISCPLGYNPNASFFFGGDRRYAPFASPCRRSASYRRSSAGDRTPRLPRGVRAMLHRRTKKAPRERCFVLFDGGQSLIENEPCVFEAVILHSNMGSNHL